MIEFDALAVGERFGPSAYPMAAGAVQRYRRAVGDHAVAAVGGRAVAPPSMTVFAVIHAINDGRGAVPGMIHAAQSLSFRAPIRVDDVLTTTGVLADKYVKRGRRYFAVDTSTVDSDGAEVAAGRSLSVFPVDDGADRGAAPGGGEQRDGDAPRPAGEGGTPSGDPARTAGEGGPAVGHAGAAPDGARSLTLRVTDEAVRLYGEAGDDFNPIHFDDRAARAGGLPARIAHGMLSGGLLSRLLTEMFGEDWLRRGLLDVRFVRPVPVGSEVTATARPAAGVGDALLDVVVALGRDPVIVGRAGLA